MFLRHQNLIYVIWLFFLTSLFYFQEKDDSLEDLIHYLGFTKSPTDENTMESAIGSKSQQNERHDLSFTDFDYIVKWCLHNSEIIINDISGPPTQNSFNWITTSEKFKSGWRQHSRTKSITYKHENFLFQTVFYASTHTIFQLP